MMAVACLQRGSRRRLPGGRRRAKLLDVRWQYKEGAFLVQTVSGRRRKQHGVQATQKSTSMET